jgi:hypothetical protein
MGRGGGGLQAMIDRAADLGMETVTIGMPHRGRLNVLGNVVRKPLAQIFSEFQVSILHPPLPLHGDEFGSGRVGRLNTTPSLRAGYDATPLNELTYHPPSGPRKATRRVN